MNKELLRRTSKEPTSGATFSPGRIAEQVRRLTPYRITRAVAVDPAPLLQQIRINALCDGKRLFMPAAGLVEGFWTLTPYTLPFGALRQAVTPHGIVTCGKRLTLSGLTGGQIGLLVTNALAVDQRGVMVAEGKGFFDLTVAILQAAGGLASSFAVVAVTGNFLTGETVVDDAQPWDVRADVVIHPGGTTEIAAARDEPPAILWEALPHQRIRRITPLWQLFQQQRKKS